LHYFCYKNIHNHNYYCIYYIADHDHAAAAFAAAADDDDDDDDDADDGNVGGDNVQSQMLPINMLTMVVISNMITTAITHMPALAFSRLPLQIWTHPPTLVCC
jgi:hypothetical protein